MLLALFVLYELPPYIRQFASLEDRIYIVFSHSSLCSQGYSAITAFPGDDEASKLQLA
jgi:hypothetical protein